MGTQPIGLAKFAGEFLDDLYPGRDFIKNPLSKAEIINQMRDFALKAYSRPNKSLTQTLKDRLNRNPPAYHSNTREIRPAQKSKPQIVTATISALSSAAELLNPKSKAGKALKLAQAFCPGELQVTELRNQEAKSDIETILDQAENASSLAELHALNQELVTNAKRFDPSDIKFAEEVITAKALSLSIVAR